MSTDICNNCRVPGCLEKSKANDKNLLSLIIVEQHPTKVNRCVKQMMLVKDEHQDEHFQRRAFFARQRTLNYKPEEF